MTDTHPTNPTQPGQELRIELVDRLRAKARAHASQAEFNKSMTYDPTYHQAAEEITRLERERDEARDQLVASLTVGGGLVVYGTSEALTRVQDYILLDSSHPVEREDVRRSLARALQAAEARATKAEALLSRAIDGLRPFAAVASIPLRPETIEFRAWRLASSIVAEYDAGRALELERGS